MQLSRLKPEVRKTYINKEVAVNSQLVKGYGILESFHNSQAIIKFKKPLPDESHLVQRSELRRLTISVTNVYI